MSTQLNNYKTIAQCLANKHSTHWKFETKKDRAFSFTNIHCSPKVKLPHIISSPTNAESFIQRKRTSSISKTDMALGQPMFKRMPQKGKYADADHSVPSSMEDDEYEEDFEFDMSSNKSSESSSSFRENTNKKSDQDGLDTITSRTSGDWTQENHSNAMNSLKNRNGCGDSRTSIKGEKTCTEGANRDNGPCNAPPTHEKAETDHFSIAHKLKNLKMRAKTAARSKSIPTTQKASEIIYTARPKMSSITSIFENSAVLPLKVSQPQTTISRSAPLDVLLEPNESLQRSSTEPTSSPLLKLTNIRDSSISENTTDIDFELPVKAPQISGRIAGMRARSRFSSFSLSPKVRVSSRSRSASEADQDFSASTEEATQSTAYNEEVTYIPSHQLTPLAKPYEELKLFLRDIKSNDWSKRFESMTGIRRIIVCHDISLLFEHLHQLVRDIRAEIDSLRSSLAKSALLCISDMFQGFGKMLDTELDTVLPSLLKRSGESSAFLADEAHAALDNMILHCTDQRVITCLLNFYQTGSKLQKTQATVFVDRAIGVYGERLMTSKDASKIIKTVCSFASEASTVARNSGKAALIKLTNIMGMQQLDAAIKKALTKQQYLSVHKILVKALEPSPTNTYNNSPAAFRTPTANRSIRATSPTHKRTLTRPSLSVSKGSRMEKSLLYNSPLPQNETQNSTESTSEMLFREPLPLQDQRTKLTKSRRSNSVSVHRPHGPSSAATVEPNLCVIFDGIKSGNWRKRISGLQALCDYVAINSFDSQAHVSTIIDVCIEAAADGNEKSSTAAVKAFSIIIPMLSSHLYSTLHILIPTLALGCASPNAQIRTSNKIMIDLVVEHVDATMLLEPFSHCSLYGPAKVRALCIDKLYDITAAAYGNNQKGAQNVVRYCVPVAFASIENGKFSQDCQMSAQRLLLLVHSLLGDDLFDQRLLLENHLSASTVTKLKQLLLA